MPLYCNMPTFLQASLELTRFLFCIGQLLEQTLGFIAWAPLLSTKYSIFSTSSNPNWIITQSLLDYTPDLMICFYLALLAYEPPEMCFCLINLNVIEYGEVISSHLAPQFIKGQSHATLHKRYYRK